MIHHLLSRGYALVLFAALMPPLPVHPQDHASASYFSDAIEGTSPFSLSRSESSFAGSLSETRFFGSIGDARGWDCNEHRVVQQQRNAQRLRSRGAPDHVVHRYGAAVTAVSNELFRRCQRVIRATDDYQAIAENEERDQLLVHAMRVEDQIFRLHIGYDVNAITSLLNCATSSEACRGSADAIAEWAQHPSVQQTLREFGFPISGPPDYRPHAISQSDLDQLLPKLASAQKRYVSVSSVAQLKESPQVSDSLACAGAEVITLFEHVQNQSFSKKLLLAPPTKSSGSDLMLFEKHRDFLGNRLVHYGADSKQAEKDIAQFIAILRAELLQYSEVPWPISPAELIALQAKRVRMQHGRCYSCVACTDSN